MDDVRFAALIERMDRRDAEHDVWSERFLERMRSSEQHFIEALAENTAEIRRLGEGHDRIWDSIKDMRASIQANTRAVLTVLDRLEGGAA